MPQDPRAPRKFEDIMLPPREARQISNTQLPEPASNFLTGFMDGPLTEDQPGIADNIGAVAGVLPFGAALGKLGGLGRRLMSRMMLPKKLGPSAVMGPKVTGAKSAIPEAEDGIYKIMMEREMAKRAGKPMPRAERLSNEKGSVNFRGRGRPGQIPEYRSKSGMALDVLEDMKNTPIKGVKSVEAAEPLQWQPASNVLEEFEDIPKLRAPKGVSDRLGYEGPFEFNNAGTAASLRNPARQDFTPGFAMSEDPVRYIADVKSLDDDLLKFPQARQSLKNGPPEPMTIDALIQDLADYFTTPKFEPKAFRTQMSPVNAARVRRIHDKFGPKHDK